MYCVYGNSGWYIHGDAFFRGGQLLGGSVIGGSTVLVCTMLAFECGFWLVFWSLTI